MCLFSLTDEVKKFKKKHGHKGKMRVWKMLRVYRGWSDDESKTLVGPYQSNYTYGAGINRSDSKQKKAKGGERVSEGIHVYLNKKTAMEFSCGRRSRRVVAAWVKPKELLGTNGDHAVFKTIDIPERIFNLALKGRKKLCV